MTTPDDDDPWTQPPEWVPLPDLPRWLEWRFKLPGSAPELIPVIFGGIRRFDLIYRVQDIPEDFRKSAYTYTLERRLPPGFGHADDPSRIIVKDWDLVEPDWKQGTVAGPPRWNGQGDRYLISVWWGRAEVWAESLAHDIRESRARSAAATAPSAAMPPTATSATVDKPALATGAPGRPTSMHLVRTEFARRAQSEQIAPKLAQEATALCAWLQKEHPEAPRLKPKSIMNNLRNDYNHQRRLVPEIMPEIMPEIIGTD